MDGKGLILIVAFRNLSGPTGEWRLISSRATAIYDNHGISTVALCLVHRRQLRWPNGAPEVRGLNIQFLIGNNAVSLFFKYIMLFALAIQFIWQNKENLRGIIISGPFLYPLAGFLFGMLALFGLLKVPLYLDVHGTLKEWVEFPPSFCKKHRLASLFGTVLSWFELKLAAISRRVIVVSKELEKDFIRISPSLKTFVIPCGLPSSMIYNIKTYLQSRQKWREKLGINVSDLVFVYSGGSSVHYDGVKLMA